MVATNFPAALAFVWQPGFDDPADGYHVTNDDTGGGTKGGVIETTWADAVAKGWVSGTLRKADKDALGDVLHHAFWGPACDALPGGVDLMLFNGRMMTGRYPRLFQSCLGFVGDDMDGVLGADTLGAAHQRDAATLINALTGAHYRYLSDLRTWFRFGDGWTKRLLACRGLALALVGT